ncbi:hypothetical protein OAZ20_02465 [Paracoccaceae bacterium]|nr:hypothetical protein [Paracoccaceae bacterium]
MKIISSVELSKGYEHWRDLFLANENFRQDHGINVLAYGHEEGNKDKVWICMEVESMEKMMSTVDKPEMIKLREEAGAKIETQTFVKLIE